MPQRLLAGIVLAGPVVLAFFSGGFFDRPRLVAGILVWLIVAVVAVVAGVPWPRGSAGRLVVAGLALLAVWTLVSIAWAPLPGRALDDGQRLVLYLGFLLLALAALRPRSVARWAEPAVAAGAVVVVGYGLAGRLLPGLIGTSHGGRAGGRLDQPLTYWNALGAVAALGLVLCVRLLADDERPRALRAAAAAASVPLGAGLYLTYSRGSILFGLIGLLALAVFLPRRTTLVAAGLVAAAAVLGGLCVAFFPDVAHPPRDPGAAAGAAALALLVLVAALAALAAARTPVDPGPADVRIARVAGAAIAVALVAVLVLVLAGVSKVGTESVRVPTGPRAERLRSVQSERYDYWAVAAKAFGRHPIEGLGSSGFGPEWLRKRPANSLVVRDAHSLYIETGAELGLVGLAFLALFLVGVVLVASRALAADRLLAAGPVAALIGWGVHAGLDWDWEMPGVTMPALILVAVLALAEPGSRRSA